MFSIVTILVIVQRHWKTIFWTRTICSKKTNILKLASNQCRLQQTLALWSPPVAAGVAWFPAALAAKKGACSTQDVANGLSFAGLSNCNDLKLAVAQMSRIEMISSIKSYQKTHNMTKLHILVFDGIWTSHLKLHQREALWIFNERYMGFGRIVKQIHFPNGIPKRNPDKPNSFPNIKNQNHFLGWPWHGFENDPWHAEI